jgi:hypothetical protein
LFTVYDLDLEVLRRMLSVGMVKFTDSTKGGKIIENDSDIEETLCVIGQTPGE